MKAEDLAKVLHVPFGFFYLRSAPEAVLPLPDFRAKKTTRSHTDTTVNLPDDFESNLKALLATPPPPHDVTGSRKKEPRNPKWGGPRKKGYTVTGWKKR